VSRLNAEVRRALQAPDVRERLRPEGIEPGDLDPRQFTAFVLRSSSAGGRSCALRAPRRTDSRNPIEELTMLNQEQNEQLTRTDRGTLMGDLFRRYWIPALHAWEIAEPDCAPVRVQIMGEKLVAFRDSEGRIGVIDEFCAHRSVSLWFGRNEECGLRCPYHGWKYDVNGQCVDLPSEPEESGMRKGSS